MNFCPECGIKIQENSKFCSECGFNLHNINIENNNLSDSTKNQNHQFTELDKFILSRLKINPILDNFFKIDWNNDDNILKELLQNDKKKLVITGDELDELLNQGNKKELLVIQNGDDPFGPGGINFYIGQYYSNEKRNGYGTIVNWDTVQGIFKEEDEKFIYKHQIIEYAHWIEDKKNGFGIKFNIDGQIIYVGEWVNDNKEGKGIEFSSEGILVYNGSWKDDKKNGNGKLIQSDGTSLEGDFENDMFSGKGKVTFLNGVIWEGDFIESKFLKGKKILPNGLIFEGDFVEGKLNGKGKMINPDKSICEGDFIDDDPVGDFVLIESNGVIINGYFQITKERDTKTGEISKNFNFTRYNKVEVDKEIEDEDDEDEDFEDEDFEDEDESPIKPKDGAGLR